MLAFAVLLLWDFSHFRSASHWVNLIIYVQVIRQNAYRTWQKLFAVQVRPKVRLTLFPAPPTLMTSWGSMASTQSITSLLLWERVVVTMRLSPGTSCSWNPKVPKPSIPHMVLPKTAPSPSWKWTTGIKQSDRFLRYSYKTLFSLVYTW